jgi:hypothetical protein
MLLQRLVENGHFTSPEAVAEVPTPAVAPESSSGQPKSRPQRR